MKKTFFLMFVMVASATTAAAQRLNLEIPSLASRASESVEVTLDAQMLRLASKFLSNHDADQRAIREVVSGLEGVYVRSYEFDKEGEYDRAIVDRVRSQLGPTWKKLVTVKSRTKDNVEIYADTKGDKISGLVVISADPRELTLVNIVGVIDLEKLSAIEGQFGIPKVMKQKDGARE